MEHLLGCGAGPLSPRRARATSGQISSQASACAGAFVVGGPFGLTDKAQALAIALTSIGGGLLS
jgi:hypothetical protein